MFNPLKNIKAVEPDLDTPTDNSDYDNLINYSNSIPSEPIQEIVDSYEGVKFNDLQEIGLQTINLLKIASKNVGEKIRFNLPLLETIPLALILMEFGAIQKNENSFIIFEQEIKIKADEQKWFNTTRRKGNKNAISLAKHLISIYEKIDEFDDQKILFISACKKLTEIQNNQSAHDLKDNINSDFPHDVINNIKPINSENNNSQNLNRDKVKLDWKARDAELNNIPLSTLFEELGAHSNEDGQSGKWKIYDIAENIGLTGNQWYSWNAQRGGHGAISYMKYHLAKLNNLNLDIKDDDVTAYKAAVRELINRFGSELGNFEYSQDEIILKLPFSMPHVLDFKINQVKSYLHEKRGIPLWIINKQIKASLLFAGFPSDWEKQPKNLFNPEKCRDEDVWATFLSINGEAAEMRAIKRTDCFSKILAKGSSKELGGFLLKSEKNCNEKVVVALEASIDACSYHAIYPGRIATSCMGVNFNLAIKAALEALSREGIRFELAFDNDLAGNEAAVRFKEKLIEEIGDDEYKENIKNNLISYFDLGIRCLKETVENGGVYYFDVLNNKIGRDAATMFQEQLSKNIGSIEVKKLVQNGKLKYANLWPDFGSMQDPQKEALNIYNSLNSDKPFYFRIKELDSEEEQKRPELKLKREKFLQCFEKLSEDKKDEWIKQGKLIFDKSALAKDWNEYFLVQKQKPEFREYLIQQENTYSHYTNNKTDEIKKNNNKPK